MAAIGFLAPDIIAKDWTKDAEAAGLEAFAAPAWMASPATQAEFDRAESLAKECGKAYFPDAAAAESCFMQFKNAFKTKFAGVEIAAGDDDAAECLSRHGLTARVEPSKPEGFVSIGAEGCDSVVYERMDAGMGNAFMHLFTKIKRGEVSTMAFLEPEDPATFMRLIRSYMGPERADAAVSKLSIITNGPDAAKVAEETIRKPDHIFDDGSFKAFAESLGKIL